MADASLSPNMIQRMQLERERLRQQLRDIEERMVLAGVPLDSETGMDSQLIESETFSDDSSTSLSSGQEGSLDSKLLRMLRPKFNKGAWQRTDLGSPAALDSSASGLFPSSTSTSVSSSSPPLISQKEQEQEIPKPKHALASRCDALFAYQAEYLPMAASLHNDASTSLLEITAPKRSSCAASPPEIGNQWPASPHTSPPNSPSHLSTLWQGTVGFLTAAEEENPDQDFGSLASLDPKARGLLADMSEEEESRLIELLQIDLGPPAALSPTARGLFPGDSFSPEETQGEALGGTAVIMSSARSGFAEPFGLLPSGYLDPEVVPELDSPLSPKMILFPTLSPLPASSPALLSSSPPPSFSPSPSFFTASAPSLISTPETTTTTASTSVGSLSSSRASAKLMQLLLGSAAMSEELLSVSPAIHFKIEPRNRVRTLLHLGNPQPMVALIGCPAEDQALVLSHTFQQSRASIADIRGLLFEKLLCFASSQDLSLSQLQALDQASPSFAPRNPATRDPSFADVLLCIYPHYLSSRELFNYLPALLEVPQCRERSLELLSLLIRCFPERLSDPSLCAALCELLQRCGKPPTPFLERLARSEARRSSLLLPVPSDSVPLILQDLTLPGTSAWHQATENDLARLITAVDHALFMRILPDECLRWPGLAAANRRQEAPNVMRFVRQVNYWYFSAARLVLSSTSPQKRCAALTKLLRILLRLKSLGNLSAMVAIHSSLSALHITRLQQTWALLPAKYLRAFHSLTPICNPERNPDRLPAIPHLPIILSSFEACREIPDHVITDDGPTDLVNWNKALYLTKVLLSIHFYKKSRYGFKPCPAAILAEFAAPHVVPIHLLITRSLALEEVL